MTTLRSRRNAAALLVLALVSTLTVVGAFTRTLSDAATVFTVDTTGDLGDALKGDGICADVNGDCSLRAALEETNQLKAGDTIRFDIPVADPGHSGGVWTITPGSNLPDVVAATTIDATTQAGWTAGGAPVVYIDGVGSRDHGFVLNEIGIVLRGFAVGNMKTGAVSVKKANATVTDMYLGLAPDGSAAPAGSRTLYLENDNAQIGTPGRGNVIANGTEDEVHVHGTGNVLHGNIIGLDPTGTIAMGGTGVGVGMHGADQTTIGGGGAGEGNLIAGNGAGVDPELEIDNGTTTVQGNVIGLLADGVTPAGTATFGIEQTNEGGGDVVVIGGTGAGEGNTIGGALGDGIYIHKAVDGTPILGNSIVGNGGLGIDLQGGTEDGFGVTANDALDGDGDANDLLNYPVLTGNRRTEVSLLLDAPAGTHLIEVFRSPAADASGYGEGAELLGRGEITHGGTGVEAFTISGLTLIDDGDALTTTTTSCTAAGCATPVATSEFSLAYTAVRGPEASGTVYEDVDGDGAVTDDGVGAADVDVRLYLDDGDGVPDDGDPMVGATVTAADGSWWIPLPAANGTVWAAFGPQNLSPSSGLAGALGDVLPDQTWAAAGAATHDGASWSFTGASGALHGGARLGVSDGFPVLGAAEHVLRATSTGVDVTGLDVAFSFQAVTTTVDEVFVDGITDAARWATYDPSAAGVGADPSGYARGVVADGHLYLTPAYRSSGLHGEFLRYDLSADFQTAGSYEVFDATVLGAGHVNYNGGVSDGRYVYFAPMSDGGGEHGLVLRYDTQGAFTSAASWTSFDIETNLAGAPSMLTGAGFDGQHLYLLAADGDGHAVRFDTTGTFTDAASWESISLPGIGVSGALVGVDAEPGFDGRYLYWSSFTDGEVLRFDTTGTFSDPTAWLTYDHVAAGVGGVGYRGVVVADGALYLVPHGLSGAEHGEVVRYDLTRAFTDPSAWSSYDPGVGTKAYGFDGGTFDGRYVWFAPSFDTAGALREVLRYDTTGTFASDASWDVVDVSGATVGATSWGYDGAYFDGRYVFLVPDGTSATLTHGLLARYDTQPAGQGTLRTFLANAAGTTGTQTSRFALSTADSGYDAASGSWDLLTTRNLAVDSTVVLDGTTQAGWVDDPVVHLDGGAHVDVFEDGRGLTLSGGGVTVRGLALTGFPRNGIWVDGDDATIVDTWVGVAPDGTIAGSTGWNGIAVQAVTTATIGSGLAGEEVVLVDAAQDGLRVAGAVADLTVDGVLVGVTSDGTIAGNGAHGIAVAAAATGSITDSTVTGNGGTGVSITDVGARVAVTDSSIHGNGGLGIDLGGDGADVIDVGDADAGPNDRLNAPVLVLVGDEVGAVEATITLDVPAGDHRVQLFRNPSGLDPTAGEGEVLVGQVDVTSTGVPLSVTIPVPGVSVDDDVTATTTTLAAGLPSFTSEFSAGVAGPGDVASATTPLLDDSSPGREDGRPIGMDASDVVAGQVGDGLDLDGVDDRVALFGPTPATGTQTVSMWVNAAGSGTIATRHDGTQVVWELARNGDDLEVTLASSGGPVLLQGTGFPAGSWVHVGFVVDGTDARAYVDGVEVDQVTADFTLGAADRTWIGGGGADGTTAPFAGAVDEVRISDTAAPAARFAAEVALTTAVSTLGTVQVLGDARWSVDLTTGRTDSSSVRAPQALETAWLTLDGVDEVGLELRSWWLTQGSPEDVGVGVRAVPGTDDVVQDEVTLDASGWGLTRRDGGRTDLVAPPAGQSPGGAWQQVIVRTDQDGSLSALADGVGIGPFPGPGVRPSGTVGLRTSLLTGIQRWWVDDLLVRRYVTPEPTARLAPSQPSP